MFGARAGFDANASKESILPKTISPLMGISDGTTAMTIAKVTIYPKRVIQAMQQVAIKSLYTLLMLNVPYLILRCIVE